MNVSKIKGSVKITHQIFKYHKMIFFGEKTLTTLKIE